MSAEGLVRAFLATLGDGDLGALDRLLAEDCVDAGPVGFQPPGRAGVAWKLALWRASAPNSVVTLETLSATPVGADARWTTDIGWGQPPSQWWGRFVVVGERIQSFAVERV